jgi:hypothetical protein
MTGCEGIRIVLDVHRSCAISQLPELHAVAIRLRDYGLGDEGIAVALGIDESQVPVMLRLADSKLASLMDDGAPVRSVGSP